MITSAINFSQLEDRVDAWYYQPKFLEIERLLGNESLLGSCVRPIKEKKDPTENPESLFRYIEIDNVNIYSGEITTQEFLGRDTPSRARKGVVVGDCIVSTVRPNRNAVGLITGDLKACVCSTGFSVLRSYKFLPEFLFIFLKSRLGAAQLSRPIMAAMYPAISEADILKIHCPIPSKKFQQYIKDLVEEAHQKQEQAEEKYKEAEELLGRELGIKDLKFETQKTFKSSFSEIGDRLDPEYYQPKFYEVEKILSKYRDRITLGDISTPPKYGTSEDLYYVEKGVPLLRVTDIDRFYTIDPSQGKFISYEDAERLRNYQVQEGDIIISRTGTLGSAVLIDQNLSGSAYGSYFIKVTPKHPRLSPQFIAFFLNSRLGKLQSEKWASGGIQTNLTIEAIKSLVVPILSKPTQKKITDLVRQSHEAREKAKELIDRAKREVETSIEI
jgi:restriction endonuclease S subunit